MKEVNGEIIEWTISPDCGTTTLILVCKDANGESFRVKITSSPKTARFLSTALGRVAYIAERQMPKWEGAILEL